MKYDKGYEKYDKEEEPKSEPHLEESKPHFEKSECGEIKIKAENVYITINCKEKKERKDY
jgi:hypothetical protein